MTKIDGQPVETVGEVRPADLSELDEGIILRLLTPVSRPEGRSYYAQFSSGSFGGAALYGEVVLDGAIHFTRPEMARITEILRARNIKAKEQRDAAH